MKKVLFILLWIISLMAAVTVKVAMTEPDYKIVRDTVLIDPSRRLSGDCGEYQIVLEPDSVYIYDGQRLVSVQHYYNSNVDSILIKDNE